MNKKTPLLKIKLTLLFLFAYLFCITQPKINNSITNLKVDSKTTTYKINKNESKYFSFELIKDTNYIITVEQKGVDLNIKLKDNEGTLLSEKDSPNGAFGPEIIEFTPNLTQHYSLQIIPLSDNECAHGKFTINIIKPNKISKPIQAKVLTLMEMKNDLLLFKKIRETANSGFNRYRNKHELDSIYNWAFNEIKTPKTILEFYKIILKLTDFEGSLHNTTTLPNPLNDYLRNDKGYFPLHMKYIQGSIVVNSIHPKILLGSKIISVNGIKDEQLMESFYKYYTTDGYNTSQKKILSVENSFINKYKLEFGEIDSFLVEYQLPSSKATQTIILNSISLNEKLNTPLHSFPYDSLLNYENQKKYNFKFINKNTALLNIRIFTMGGNEEDEEHKQYIAFMDSVFLLMKKNKEIKNLIIDIRNNPGGNDPNQTKSFTYLTDKPFKENKLAFINFKTIPFEKHLAYNSNDGDNQKRERDELQNELTKEFSILKNKKYYQNDNANPTFYPSANMFSGNIYLLINENVASAASNFAALVRGNTSAIIIGKETTGGYYGHNGHTPIEYVLPNTKIKTKFSIVYLEQYVTQKANQPFGRGIMPDYEIEQSFEDFIHNKDTQMEFTLKLISK